MFNLFENKGECVTNALTNRVFELRSIDRFAKLRVG
jgi:hypothetical protein